MSEDVPDSEASAGRVRCVGHVVPGAMSLFLASLVSHVVPFAGYMVLTAGPAHAAVGLTRLHVFWPVFLGMAGVAATQAALWQRIPPTRPYLLGSCLGRGFLVEAVVLVVALLVLGWSILAPFFLMGGLAACLAAAAVIERRRGARLSGPGP